MKNHPGKSMSKRTRQFNMEILFRALSDRTRLRLINLMGLGEVCVCFLVEIIGPNQPKISRHLAYLRKAGIVAARREGKWMHYRLVSPVDDYAQHIMDNVRQWLAQEPEMQRDLSRLTKFCCAVKLPEHLQDAPRPAPLQNL